MNADAPVEDGLSERVIGCAFKVANTLGVGFLEKVYENALGHELRLAGLATRPEGRRLAPASAQAPFQWLRGFNLLIVVPKVYPLASASMRLLSKPVHKV